ncbi:MAG TPA: tetratricopeptide repeat protein [Allosphingosinicella sp.]|nr:tetratricopeptide repeat protein [Allosphingosinicella sp.]
MKRIAWKFAASSALLGVTTVGCVMNGVGTAPASALESEGRAQQQAKELFERAGRAIADNKVTEAVFLLEQAVMISPRDAGYRLLLADAYMKSGRFQSAETTYRDVLSIDPSRTRAALGLALMQVAAGRHQEAMSQLERLEGSAAPADLGLAYALAGAPQRAVDLLEPAARAQGATPRVRQNLALAYAFGGDWQRARTIAAQDVSPSELASRMSHWADLAGRSGAPDQVAALLGVTPARDAGQPVRIALNTRPPAVIEAPQAVALAAAEPVTPPEAAPVPAPVAFAAAEVPTTAVAEAVQAPAPVAAQVPPRVAFAEAAPAAPVMPAVAAPMSAPQAAAEPVTAPPPVAWAQAEPVAIPAPVPAPAPLEAPAVEYAELEAPEWGVNERGRVELPEEAPAAERAPVRVQYAAAAESLVRPDPVVMPVASRAVRSMATVASRALRAAPLPGSRSASGQYVVQIGSFSSAANAARAWKTYETKYGLRSEQPVTMTIDHNGRLLHRVAISGFGKRGDAAQVCRVIRTRGGECFVRINAGDKAIDWAARYASRS